MSLHVTNFEIAEEMFEKAAQDFVVLFDRTLENKQYFDVALSGGGTAKTLFGFLINCLAGHQHLNRLRFFFSDERVVEQASTDSNAGNAMRLLLKPLAIDSSQFFPMYDGKNSADTCARDYESLIKKHIVSNANDVPIFDLIYLGIGQDGHTASLFPMSDVLKDAHSLIRSVNQPGIPFERITMMPRLINAAAQIHVLAYGQGKAAVMNDIVNGPILPEALPAQLVVRNDAGHVTLFTADLGHSE